MKKISIILLVTILALINLSACTLETEYTHSNLIEKTADLAEDVYNAIKNHDSEQFKNLFCESLQSGKEYSMRKIYNFLDGEIASVETDFGNDEDFVEVVGGETQYDKFSKSFNFKIIIVTDKGTRYEIFGKGDIVNTIDSRNEGLQEIDLYRQNKDETWDYEDTLQIGSEIC